MAPFIGYLVKTNFMEGKVMDFMDCLVVGMLIAFVFAAYKANARSSRLQKELNWHKAEPMLKRGDDSSTGFRQRKRSN